MSECTYLGHKIENGGVKPEEIKVKAITGKNKKEVQSFLEMIRYYWWFVQNFATKAELITNLTKKDLPDNIEWTEETETGYKTLKHDLSHSVMLQTSPKHSNFRQTLKM